MTVQELIDILNRIENKEKMVFYEDTEEGQLEVTEILEGDASITLE